MFKYNSIECASSEGGEGLKSRYTENQEYITRGGVYSMPYTVHKHVNLK